MDEDFIPKKKLEILQDLITGSISELIARVEITTSNWETLEPKTQLIIDDSIRTLVRTMDTISIQFMELGNKTIDRVELLCKEASKAAVRNIEDQSQALVIKGLREAGIESFRAHKNFLEKTTDRFSASVDNAELKLATILKSASRPWYETVFLSISVGIIIVTGSITLFRVMESKFPILKADAQTSFLLGQNLEYIWSELKPATQVEIQKLMSKD